MGCVGICGGFMGCRLCRSLSGMRCKVFRFMRGINEMYGV